MGLLGLGLTVRAMASGTACQVELTAWEKKRVPDASRRKSWKLTSLKWETARETLVLLVVGVALERCDVRFRVQSTVNGSTVEQPGPGPPGWESSESPATHQWTYLWTAATCAKRTRKKEKREWTPLCGLLASSLLK